MAAGGSGATRTSGSIGARAARVVLAASASSVLTAVVALPMAYQAHEARQASSVVPTTEAPSVLGTTTVPSSAPRMPESTTTTATDGSPGPTTGPSTTTGSPAPGDAPATTDAPRPGGTGGTNGEDAEPTTTVPRFVAPPPTDAPPATGVGPSSTGPPPTSPPPVTEVPASAQGLYVSVVTELLRAVPLVDSVLGQPAFVFLDLPNVVRVEFFLDDEHTATELFAPFELFGGPPLLPLLLEPGTHTVRAVITFVDGSTTERVASFTTLGPG